MKRKFFISLILTFFFLSSTGIPQVIHQCNLTGEKSLDFCAACSEKEHENSEASCCETVPVEEPSCCEDEAPAGTAAKDDSCVIVKADEHTCCSDQVNLLKITDNFSTSTAQKSLDAGTVVIATVDVTFNALSGCNTEGYQQDIPPPLFGKHLLYSLHQLKIATPLS